jgi:hypothetical protein
VAEMDAPGLEAHFIRMKEAVADRLTRFSAVGAVVESVRQRQWETRRNAALAALGEAALEACAKDEGLKVRLSSQVSPGNRGEVEALFAGELDSCGAPSGDAAGSAADVAPAVARPSAPAAQARAEDPAVWSSEDFRCYVREHHLRNRTELKKLNAPAYRVLQKQHPALLDELLPSQRSGSARKARAG